jgi:O-antigen/teichoic acid export membrane protein
VTTYVVLVLAGRALGPSRFGALSVLYVLMTSVATGLFLPLEQELARRRGDERGRGVWDGTLLLRTTVFGLLLGVGAVVVCVAGFPVSLRLLGQHRQLLAALAVGLLGYACCFVTRGEFAGRAQLRRYGGQLAVEGGVRLVGALALVVADVRTVEWYGWLFGIAPWVALGCSTLRWRRPAGSPTLDTPVPLPRNLALLLVSSLAAQLLINAGPLVAALLARSDERAQVGVFLAALTVVRVPVFLFTAVQPSFLPAMAQHAASDRRESFMRLLRGVLTGATILVAVSTAGAVGVGPWALHLLFGFDHNLDRLIFLQMTLAVGLFLVAAILAQSLLGRGEHAATTTGWLAGLVGLGAGTTIGHDTITRAAAGFLLGAATATTVLAFLLSRAMSRWSVPPQTSREDAAKAST